MRLRFRDLRFDAGTRSLTRGDRPVPLSPKAFRLLEVLVMRRPDAVAHEELRRTLWSDVADGGTTLARLVSEIRTALDDHDDARPIVRPAIDSATRSRRRPWKEQPADAPGWTLRAPVGQSARSARRRREFRRPCARRRDRRSVVKSVAPTCPHHGVARERRHRGSRQPQRHQGQRRSDRPVRSSSGTAIAFMWAQRFSSSVSPDRRA